MGGGSGSGGGATYHGNGPVDRVYRFSDDAYSSTLARKSSKKKPGKKASSSTPKTLSDAYYNEDNAGYQSPSSLGRPLPPPPGLKNVGNSCYANAALQCLLSTALPHALLDERNAHIIRRHSFNRKLLVCGSGSVDSDQEDDDSDAEGFGSCLSGMTGYSEQNDQDEIITARGKDDPRGHRASPIPRRKGTPGRRRLRDDVTIGSSSTLNSDLYHIVDKRRANQQPSEADLLCDWLTQELTQITWEYTTPPQGFYDKRRQQKSENSRCATSMFGSMFGSQGNSSGVDSTNNRVVDPGAITRHVNKISPTLRPYQQEDAHEFFRSLLSSLTMHGQNARLSSLFDGLLESSITCCTCRKSSLTRDRYMDLSLDIADRDITSLERALDKFTEEELLDGDNMFTCSRCQVKRAVTKGLRLATAPTMLVINFKRFASDNYGRISRLSKSIEFPLRLEIADYMSRTNRGKPPPYTLVAVLVHRGRSCDCGHYFAYVRKGPDWYLANDSVVTKVDVDEVLNAQAYVLVYEVEGMKERHGFDCYSRYHDMGTNEEESIDSHSKKISHDCSPWDFSSITSLFEACEVGLCGSTAHVADDIDNPADESYLHRKETKGNSTKTNFIGDHEEIDARERDVLQSYYKRGRSHTPSSRSNRSEENAKSKRAAVFDFEPTTSSHRRAKSLSRVEDKTADDVGRNQISKVRRRSRSREGKRIQSRRAGTLPPLHEQV
mmetsp:Transcript_17554/g.36876  ORF Transcript_17554/g.36876 Transcript_17554/m.36876 type:complete len:721 (+) Transcript_17554:739-2901(+)